MKIYEIINEAEPSNPSGYTKSAGGILVPDSGKRTGKSTAKSDSKEKPSSDTDSSSKKKSSSKKGTTRFSVGPSGLVSNEGGKSAPISPKDALKAAAPERVSVAQKVSSGLWNKFTNTTLFRLFTNKYLGPIAIWLDDMSHINELYDAGMFNDHGDKAGEVSQQLRTYYTQLFFTRMGTMWVAWGAASLATGAAVRGLVALIPGLGWLANIAAFAAQGVVYALLNYEPVQKFLTLKVLENIVPEWINNPIYGIARVVGASGSMVPAYITKLKDKFLKSAPEVAKSAAQAAPGAAANLARDAATAVKNTGSAITTPAAPSAPSTGRTISGADLAKEL